MLLAGDFNATTQHAPFRQLLAAGWQSAHRLVGRPYATTFPSRWVVPPIIGIDHVLLTQRWSATRVIEVAVPGSDHLGVMASLAYVG
jgi:endonuclease/exonuclease/phosphatase (EEP) superfamily protein YafD